MPRRRKAIWMKVIKTHKTIENEAFIVGLFQESITHGMAGTKCAGNSSNNCSFASTTNNERHDWTIVYICFVSDCMHGFIFYGPTVRDFSNPLKTIKTTIRRKLQLRSTYKLARFSSLSLSKAFFRRSPP